MKHIILYPLFIFLTFHLLVGCKSDENNNSNNIINPPIEPSDTLGIVRGYISSDNEPVEDAFIVLDNDTTFSDVDGFFEFTDCIMRTLDLSITHPEFSSYNNLINVTDSLNLTVILSRSHYDYFPLKVGNEWQYHWINSGSVHGGGSWYNPGLIKLKIETKSGKYPNFIFNVRETYYDSTYSSTNVSYFTIHSLNNDSIKFVGTGTSKLFYNYGDDITLPRYLTTNYPEIQAYYITVSLRKQKRNIGLIYYELAMGGTLSQFFSAELIYYNLL